MIRCGLKLIIIYKKHRQKEKISQNGPVQSFNLTRLLGNPTTDSRFRITLEREGRPGLKLCKSPGAESTVEKKKKQIGTSSFVMKLHFTFILVPREK